MSMSWRAHAHIRYRLRLHQFLASQATHPIPIHLVTSANLWLRYIKHRCSLILLFLDHPFLQLHPIRPGLFLPAQHQLDQPSQVIRVDLLEPMEVVLHGFPVHPCAVVSVALVLILQQSGLEDDHS